MLLHLEVGEGDAVAGAFDGAPVVGVEGGGAAEMPDLVGHDGSGGRGRSVWHDGSGRGRGQAETEVSYLVALP